MTKSLNFVIEFSKQFLAKLQVHEIRLIILLINYLDIYWFFFSSDKNPSRFYRNKHLRLYQINFAIQKNRAYKYV